MTQQYSEQKQYDTFDKNVGAVWQEAEYKSLISELKAFAFGDELAVLPKLPTS